jgi:hypothetical protein
MRPPRCWRTALRASSTAALDTNRHRLPPEQHQRIFDRHIAPLLLDGCAPAEVPHAIVLGTHLGCGVEAAMRAACEGLGGPGAAVELVLDDLRAFHPHHAELLARDARLAAFYTDGDAHAWLAMAVAEATRRRLSLVLEAAMRSEDQVVAAFDHLRQAGYRVEARALAVPHAVSWQTILLSQELVRAHLRPGRRITPGAHQATYDGLPRMLARIERERLAGVVTVFDRHGHCRYRHDLSDPHGSRLPQAVTFLHIHRELPLSLAELRALRDGFAALEALFTDPARKADNEDLLRIDTLRWEAECALLAEAFLCVPEKDCVAEFPQLQGAFTALREVAWTAAGQEDEQLALRIVKKTREAFARRIANGNVGASGAAPY